MDGSNKGYWVVGVLAALFGIDSFFHVHDMYTVILWVVATGALVVAWNRQTAALAVSLFLLGVYWSRLDQSGCSGYWRTSYLLAKASGQLDEMPWGDVYRAAFSNDKCPDADDFEIKIEQIQEEQVGDVIFREYRTPRGDFWLPGNSRGTLTWLLWEIYKDKVYQGHTVRISEGGTVIDCGAHVGVLTRYALDQGAIRVVAIEPDPANIFCFRRNFAEEIAAGIVTLVEKGVWSKKTTIRFEHNVHDSSRHTVQHQLDPDIKLISIPVVPLDKIVSELDLERIDFIKMDIEGAERDALLGAQATMKRFRPDMAICSYHRPDDPSAIRAAVAQTGIPYAIHARTLSVGNKKSQPKVLFFGNQVLESSNRPHISATVTFR